MTRLPATGKLAAQSLRPAQRKQTRKANDSESRLHKEKESCQGIAALQQSDLGQDQRRMQFAVVVLHVASRTSIGFRTAYAES